MEELIPNILIVTININELNLPSKRQTLYWIRKRIQGILFTADKLKYKDIKTEVNKMDSLCDKSFDIVKTLMLSRKKMEGVYKVS